MPHPIQEPPDRAFWLDELLALDFDEVAGLPDDFDNLLARLRRAFRGDKTKEVLDRALDWFGRTPEVAKNLVLLSRWLSAKPSPVRSDAVGEVARRCLPADVVEEYRYITGDYQRHALATMLFAFDRDALFEIDQWNRIEDCRRGVFRMTGQRKKLPRTWATVPWRKVVEDALKAIRPAWTGRGAPPELRRVSCSADGSMVLLGLRRPSTRAGHRDGAGRVSTGRRDAWTFVLVQDEGRRMEVGGADDEHVAGVVGPLGCTLFEDDITYDLAVSVVTGDDLDRLILRLFDPEERILSLLEITAEFPESWNRTAVHLANTGQVSVAELVRWLRRAGSRYGEDWREVRSVHVGFQEKYRIQIHFPPPGGPRIVSFSQVGRRRASNDEFRKFWKDELGWEVFAKSRLERAAWLKAEKKPSRPPRKLKEGDWDRLLSGVVANPERWEQQALRKAEATGVVRLQRRSWFLCGSPAAHRRGPASDTLDCDGIVEFDWRDIDPNDPLRHEDDHAVFCSAAGKHEHHPLWDRIPLQRRLRVDLDPAGAFQHVLGLLAGEDVTEEEPGVGGGWTGDPEAVVVVRVPGLDPRRLDASLAGQQNPCWVLLPGGSAPDGFEGRGVPLARVLADGAAAITAVWKKHGRGAAGPAARRQRRAVPAPPTPSPAPASAPPTPPRPPIPVRLTCDGRGRLTVNGRPLFGKPSRGVALYLALLAKAADQDRAGDRREYPTAPPRLRARNQTQIAALAPKGSATGGTVANWLYRLRSEIERGGAGVTMADLVVEEAGSLIRLADEVSCEGFDIALLARKKVGAEVA